MRSIFSKIKIAFNRFANYSIGSEQQLLMLGKLLCERVSSKSNIASIKEVEFKVFSQWGDDGIIQWLVRNVEMPNDKFIEFGVQDYLESNTRFLMMNNNWSGMVIDGSERNIERIRTSEYFWRHELVATCAFIDAENINGLLQSTFENGSEVGILHIDLDGNDYWIWKEITAINPAVVILEYNSIFGKNRAITVPYDKNFHRTKAHFSNLYFGASLRALQELSANKGYAFIGCNSAGNNAYFVRRDKLNGRVTEVSLDQGYVESKFRECRDRSGRLTFQNAQSGLATIRGHAGFQRQYRNVGRFMNDTDFHTNPGKHQEHCFR